MTYCSHCGIQNRDGSKFCNNCGARMIAEQGLRCPMCSTLNQVENVFCSSCGARLVPLVATPPAEPKAQPAAPIKGLSLPAKSEPKVEALPEPKIESQNPPEPTKVELENKSEPAISKPAESQPSVESAVSQELPNIEQGEIPDWIARLRSGASGESVEDDGILVEEIPDWLKPPATQETQVVSAPAPEPEPGPAPVETPAPQIKIQVPDWLNQVGIPSGDSQSVASSAEPNKSEDELPDWLKQATTNFSLDPGKSPITTDELPDWLRPDPSALTQETQPTVAVEPVAEEPQVPGISDQAVAMETTGNETTSDVDELPDWLRDAEIAESDSLVATTPTPSLPMEVPPASGIPDWVAALKPKDADAIAPSFGGEKSEESIQAGEIPPWLAAIKPQEAETIQPTMPASPQVEESAESDLPAWVMALKPKEADQAPAQSTQEQSAGEIPAWVAALKPKDMESASSASETALTSSQGVTILSDLPGILPLATALTQPHAKQKRAVSTERREGALVFESLLASVAEPVVAETLKPARKRTMRPLIYILILLAVVVPFIVPMDALVPITQVPAESFFDLVNGLPANAPVVVSFDYDPGTAGEMDLLAQAVVRHLIQRGAKILAVSTLDTGPQMAQRIMSGLEQENGKIKYGSDYAIVYLPSNELSLSQIATNDLPTRDYKNNSIDSFLKSANIKSFRNAALIIEIAGRDDRLKMWIEQVQPRANVKMAAAVSAAVEPKARAYRGSNQLVALTSGLLGAAQYEALSRQSGQTLIAVNSQSIAQIVLIFIIVLGNVVRLISRARGQTA